MSNGPIYLWEIIYQAKTQPVPAKEDIARLEWTTIWPEPVRIKPQLHVSRQPFLAEVLGFTPVNISWLAPLSLPVRIKPTALRPEWTLIPQQTTAVVSTAVYAADVSSPGPTFKWRLIYRTKTEPVFVPVQTVIPYAGWDDTLEWPRPAQPRSPAYSAPFLAQQLGVFQDRDSLAWLTQLSEPTRRKPPLAPDWPLIPQQTPVVTVTWGDWTNWPDFTTRAKRAADLIPWTFIPPAAQVWFPYGPWDDFARRKPQPLDTQPLAYSTTQIAAPIPVMAWTNWPDFAPKKPAPLNFNPLALVQLAPQVWYPPNTWPEIVPTRPKPVVDFIPWSFIAPFPAFPWTQWTSWPEIVPTRKKPAADFQPWVFIEPPPQVWFPYGPWDDFARRKPQPLDTAPLIWSSFTPPPAFFLVPDRWPDLIYRKPVPLNFVPLTLVQTVQAPWTQWTQWPDRIWKKSPPIETQPLAYLQTVRTPWNELSRWPELVPIRGKKGLLVPLHPAFFMFPGKITGATISIIMAAHEINSDTALWAINVLSSPQPSAVSAAVSIEEGFGGMGATSIVEH